MRRFERVVGKKHASYFTYVGYGQPFPRTWVEEVKAVGAVPHLAWEPNEGLEVIRDDAYLRGWAREARAAACPIFLRFASEMNGAWMAYHGNPALYIEKWRLVHEVMEEEAPNVAMVWCPFAFPRRNIPDYYPGDEYVDWVGVNIYSVYYHNADRRQPAHREDPRELLRYVYDLYADRKPIMIAEYAATHYCRAYGGPTVGFALEKMTLLYRSLPTEFPRVKMINWFNWNTLADGAADNNYCLTDDQRICQRYSELIRSDYFLSTVPAEGWGTPPSEKRPPVPTPSRPERMPGPPISPRVRREIGEKQGARGHWQPLSGVEARARWSALPRGTVALRGIENGDLVSGPVTLRVQLASDVRAKYVVFRVNNRLCRMTNRAPYLYLWNPAPWPEGEYRLQAVVYTTSGDVLQTETVRVTVRHGAGT